MIIILYFDFFDGVASRNATDYWLGFWASHAGAAAANSSSGNSSTNASLHVRRWYPLLARLGSGHRTPGSPYVYDHEDSGTYGSTRTSSLRSLAAAAGDEQQLQVSFYMYVYVGLAVANTLFTLLRAFFFAFGGLLAARVVHERLLDCILHVRIQLFSCSRHLP